MRSKLSLALALAGTVLLVAIAAGTIASLAGGLNAKERFAQRIEQQNAAAAAAARPRLKSEGPGPVPASSKAARVAGIFDIQQGPVPSYQFAVNNQWHGPVGNSSDTWWGVYAGSKRQGAGSPDLPAVYVETSTPSSDGYSFQTAFVGIFLAPNADSSLRITAVNGTTIDLQTQSGRIYHFNLVTNLYQ